MLFYIARSCRLKLYINNKLKCFIGTRHTFIESYVMQMQQCVHTKYYVWKQVRTKIFFFIEKKTKHETNFYVLIDIVQCSNRIYMGVCIFLFIYFYLQSMMPIIWFLYYYAILFLAIFRSSRSMSHSSISISYVVKFNKIQWFIQEIIFKGMQVKESIKYIISG